MLLIGSDLLIFILTFVSWILLQHSFFCFHRPIYSTYLVEIQLWTDFLLTTYEVFDPIAWSVWPHLHFRLSYLYHFDTEMIQRLLLLLLLSLYHYHLPIIISVSFLLTCSYKEHWPNTSLDTGTSFPILSYLLPGFIWASFHPFQYLELQCGNLGNRFRESMRHSVSTGHVFCCLFSVHELY